MIKWSTSRIVFHSSCCFKVWKSNSQCYFYTSWSLLHKNSFQLPHLVQVVGFWALFAYFCFILEYQHSFYPATKGLVRLNHWSSILSFKCVQAELYSESWTYKSGTFFPVCCVMTIKSNHRSGKKKPKNNLNYYSWTGWAARTMGK